MRAESQAAEARRRGGAGGGRRRRRGLRRSDEAAARCGSTAARSRASPRRPQRGVGVRAWIGGRVGYAYGTDLSEQGAGGARRGRPPRPPRSPTRTSSPRPRGRRRRPALDGLSDPSIASWTADRVVELALGGRARRARRRRAHRRRRDRPSTPTPPSGSRSAPRPGSRARTRPRALLRLPAGARRRAKAATETGLGFGLARGPDGLDPEAIGREGAERAVAMIGAGKPRLARLPGRPRPHRRRQLRRPDRRRRWAPTRCSAGARRSPSGSARRSPSEALVLHDDGLDPEGLGLGARSTARASRARRTALIEGGTPAHLPLRHLHGASRRARRSTGNAGRGGYRSPPSVSHLQPDRRRRATLDSRGCSAQAGDGVYVTDVAGLHSGVNPVSGVFSVGASGRVIRGGELAEPVREFTIASDLVSMLRAVAAAGAEARWVPFGGSVQDAAAAGRRDDGQRRLRPA